MLILYRQCCYKNITAWRVWKINILILILIELRDGQLRAENGWLDVMRSFEMAVSRFGSDTIILDPDLDPTWS